MRIYKIFLTLCLAVSAVCGHGDVTAELSDNTAVAGEAIYLILRSPAGMAQLVGPLSGDNWRIMINERSSASQTSIINGKRARTYTVQYPLVAEKPGEIVIPPLTVKVDGKEEKTAELRCKIVAAAEKKAGGLPLAEAVSGKVRILSARRSFYVGEEVPFSVDFFALQGSGINLQSYPDLKIPHAVFRDYRAENREDGRFGRPRRAYSTLIDARRFDVIEIPGAFRSLAPGKCKMECELTIGVPEQKTQQKKRNSPFDDDFFADFMSGFDGPRLQRYQLNCQVPDDLTFKSLPPLPEGSFYLGLIGKWQIDTALDEPEKIAVGDVLTFSLRISGDTVPETLNPPKLTVPGFRIYPPEVKKNRTGSSVAVNYSFIPLHAGKQSLDFKFAVLDPQTGKYVDTVFRRAFDVAPSERPLNGVSSGVAPEKDTAAIDGKNDDVNQSLLYIKSKKGGNVALPIWRTWLWESLLIGLGAPLLFILFEWLGARSAAHRSDGAFLRREAARRGRHGILAAVDEAKEPGDFCELINDRIVPALNDRFDLVPGSGVNEVCRNIPDDEFAALLRRAAEHAYSPLAFQLPVEESRKILRDGIKKLLLFFLFTFAVILPVQGAEAFADGVKAYDNGDFKQAAAIFQRLAEVESQTPDPALLYNLGAANYMLADYPLALYYLESAHRIAPRDSDIGGNLNLVRRKLGLPEIGKAANPLELAVTLRDMFTPGEWLLAAALFFALAFAALAVRRRISPHTAYVLSGIMLCGMLLGLAAMISQINGGPYSSGRAIALGGGAALHTLPGTTGRSSGTVPGGHEMRVLESRSGYSLVRSGGNEGWVKNEEIRRLQRL